ncbi:MAG: DUF2804 domain-containing protein [Chrysiogenetes bacterium]|nr:DUF2804 domain-containing protein [Chrysiogenetes bacterium]
MKIEVSAPPAARQAGAYQYGRYPGPIADPNVSVPGVMGRMRLKEWHYLSATTDRWFVAFALVQLGYVANIFAYVIDREDPANKREFEALSPGGRGLSFAKSSTEGVTLWDAKGARVRVSSEPGQWRAELDLPLGDERLEGEFFVKPEGESLGLLFELEKDRAAYTHKAAGLPAGGALRLGGRDVDLGNALGASDWTRSAARRTTKWNWAAFSGHAVDGRRVGLNLSADVYDNAAGVSQENVLFVDGKLYALEGVRFEMPKNPSREPWRLRSVGGDWLSLDFTPLGARKQRLNLGVIRSDFIQPYGTFAGTIKVPGEAPIELGNVFGVVEDHLAVW